MYEILEGLKVELKHVSPKAIKLYRDMLLKEAQEQEEREKEEQVKISTALKASAEVFTIFVEKPKVMEWASAIFDMTEEQFNLFGEKWEDYNYEEFTRGFQDFLAKLSPIVKR